MKYRASLQFRVAIAFAALGAVLSLLLSLGIHLASLEMEHRLVDETLTAEVEDYLARRARNPQSNPPATRVIHGYVWPSANSHPPPPPYVASLAPGRYSIVRDGTPYRVAVTDRNGIRLFLLYDESRVEQRNRNVALLLGFGILMTTLLAAALGRWLAFRVVSPVTELAQRVMDLKPEDSPSPLAPDYPDDEVGELALAFDRYVRRIRGFVERERNFTADLSHELRTPLTVINGAAEVLLADSSLTPAVRNRVERIQRAGQEMGELVPALLALARETEPSESPAPAVSEIINQVVEGHLHLLNGKDVDVEVEIAEEPHLQVEPVLLRTVLGNLVRNAFMYTESGRIHLRLDNRQFYLEDTGVGIPADKIERVFERHYVASSRSGSGIGLSLVKRICDRYGWKITLESTEGTGTRVRMNFDNPATI